MAVDAQFVKDVAPDLASESDTRISLFIDFAKLSVNEAVWGAKYDLGVAVMAAHLLTISSAGGATGGLAVTQEKVGDLSRSYAAPSGDAIDSLQGTAYGRWFLQLRKSLVITPLCT